MTLIEMRIKELQEAIDELNPITKDDLVLLSQEIDKRNPKAIAIKKWHSDLMRYCYEIKDAIRLDVNYAYNLSLIGEIPYSIKDLKIHLGEGDISNYRIAPYVDINFCDSRMHLVDFKRHLKSDIALDKKTEMNIDGRPDKSYYYYNDELMAIITFIFRKNDDDLVISRSEILNYIKNDGSLSVDILIKNRTFNANNLHDASLMYEEVSNSRKNIIDSLYLFTVGVIRNYHPEYTLLEIKNLTSNFDVTTLTLRDHFIRLGTSGFKEWLQDSNNTSGETWLKYIVDENGITLCEYMISVL